METLALIAGNGDLPVKVAKGARKAGKKVIAFALPGETSPELSQEVEEICWISPKNLSLIIEKLGSGTIRELTSIGGIHKLKWLEVWQKSPVRELDLEKILHRGDGEILSNWAGFVTGLGIKILDPIRFLNVSPVSEGNFTGGDLHKSLEEDVNFAFQMSKTLGYHDIGQAVVVKNKIVLAIESIEGTDATIRRGGELGKEGVVVAKTARPGQDLRLDRPVVGLKTIQVLLEIRAAVLALEADAVLMLDSDESIALARKGGLTIVARKL